MKEEEDVEMLDEDDAQTDQQLFGRRGVDEGLRERFMDRQSHRAGVVNWGQVYAALMKV